MLVIRKHEFVDGRTQSGKTHYAIEKSKNWAGGVLFWNPQNVKTGFPEINGHYDIKTIIQYLKAGKKMAYTPQINQKTALKELEALVYGVLNYHVKGELDNTLFVVDECQIFARSGGNNPIEDIATRGLGLGLFGLFVTQRPALTSNTLFTQSEVKTHFAMEDEEVAYFERQGTPMKEIQAKIKEAGEYHYIQKFKGEYSEPLKI